MVDESSFKAASGEMAAKTRDRVGQFVDEVREKAAPALESMRDKLTEQATHVKDKVVEGAEHLRKKSISDLGTDINRYVKNNPGKVVLGAFAIGIVAGAILRGRNRS